MLPSSLAAIEPPWMSCCALPGRPPPPTGIQAAEVVGGRGLAGAQLEIHVAGGGWRWQGSRVGCDVLQAGSVEGSRADAHQQQYADGHPDATSLQTRAAGSIPAPGRQRLAPGGLRKTSGRNHRRVPTWPSGSGCVRPVARTRTSSATMGRSSLQQRVGHPEAVHCVWVCSSRTTCLSVQQRG